MAREDSGGEEGAEPLVDINEQAAMQQEDRVLTEQIENLQKKKLVMFCICIYHSL